MVSIQRYECVKQNSLLTFSRNSMATTAYLRVSTGTQGPPSSCKSRSQRRLSPRLSASASHHLPLYQDKAVTPTPLKDIFTPIWARPFLIGSDRICQVGTLPAARSIFLPSSRTSPKSLAIFI